MWNSRWRNLKMFTQLLINWLSCDSYQGPGEPKESMLSTLWGLWGNDISVLDKAFSFPKRVSFFCFLNSCQTSVLPPQTCLYRVSSFWTGSSPCLFHTNLWLWPGCLHAALTLHARLEPLHPHCQGASSAFRTHLPSCHFLTADFPQAGSHVCSRGAWQNQYPHPETPKPHTPDKNYQGDGLQLAPICPTPLDVAGSQGGKNKQRGCKRGLWLPQPEAVSLSLCVCGTRVPTGALLLVLGKRAHELNVPGGSHPGSSHLLPPGL